MKKLIAYSMAFIFTCHACSAQDSLRDSKKEKLHFKAIINTDSGIQKGYLWQTTDSTILLSNKKRIMSNPVPSKYFVIPAENISVVTVKNKRFPFGEMAAGAVLGFVLTAGLWENEDVNEDGHLSFWELLFGAIDGLTSEGRGRRRTAMWVGIGGGTLGLIAGAFSMRKLTISFPFGDRRKSFQSHRDQIRLFAQ